MKVAPVAGNKRKRRKKDYASASENPLALFAKAEAPRRRRRKREAPVAHLRYGRFSRAVERSLEIERPPLSDLDGAELERLYARYEAWCSSG